MFNLLSLLLYNYKFIVDFFFLYFYGVFAVTVFSIKSDRDYVVFFLFYLYLKKFIRCIGIINNNYIVNETCVVFNSYYVPSNWGSVSAIDQVLREEKFQIFRFDFLK